MPEPISPPADDLLWRHLQSLPAFRALLRAVEARFYHMVDLPEPVLDLGCGDGHFADLTFPEVGQRPHVGLDPWWNPLVKARRAAVYPLAVQGLGHRLPFSNHTFGSAISNSVLEHIPDIQPVLNDLGRVMKPGGRFVMTMPNERFTAELSGARLAERVGLPTLAEGYRNLFNRISRHAHTESIDWWAERLAAAGFAVDRWQSYFSPAALRALELGHVQGVPSAVLHALTGQWILAPTWRNLAWVDRWLRPFYLEQTGEDGTYLFIVAHKVADRPIIAALPAARPFFVGADGHLRPAGSPAVPPAAAPFPVADRETPLAEIPTTPPAEPLPVPPREPRPSLAAYLQTSRRPLSLLIAGLVLSFLAYSLALWSAPAGILLWLAGCVTAGLAFADDRPGRLASRHPGPAVALTGGLLFTAALALRIIDLDGLPYILSGTEASFGLDAWRYAGGDGGNPFGTASFTNPSLPFYLLGVPLRLFGRTTVALRLWSPVIGALTVLAVYWAGRRLWSEGAGIAAAVFLAGSHTHIHFSRLGLTNIWDPLLALLGGVLFLLAWRENRPVQWLLAGLTWGVSAYFFTIGHLWGLLIPPLIILEILFDRRPARGGRVVAALLLALVVALPLVRHYGANENLFWERYNQYGIFPSGWLAQESALRGNSPNAILVSQFWEAVAGFVGEPDRSIYYNSGRGLLGLPVALLFLTGLAVALRGLRRGANRMLLLWLAVPIVFAGAFLLEPPASHRLLITLPAASLVAGAALAVAWEALRSRLLPGSSEETTPFSLPHLALIAFLAVALVASDPLFYFGEYRNSDRFGDPNTETAHRLGEWLSELSGETTVYLYTPPRFFGDFPNLAYLAPGLRAGQNLLDVPPGGELPPSVATGSFVFVFVPERLGELPAVERAFPGGRREAIPGRTADPLFVVYEFDHP